MLQSVLDTSAAMYGYRLKSDVTHFNNQHPAEEPWRQHADRDYRTTTFSCCLCGGAGVMASDKPPDHIREDPRSNPQRARLTGRPVRPSLAFHLRERPPR